MRNFGRPLALLLASGLWAASAGAQNLVLSNTATRGILIQTEDTACTNNGTNDPGFYPAGGNGDCTAAGLAGTKAAPLCTGLGTGTYVNATLSSPPNYPRESQALQPGAYYPVGTSARGDKLSPDFQVAPAGCTQYATGGTPDFTDTTTDFYATLSFNGGTSWTITVPQPVWGAAVAKTLENTPGTTLTSNTTLAVNFNSATGVVSPTVPPDFYSATASYAGPPVLALTLRGQTSSPDGPYFAVGYQVGNTAPLSFSCAGALAVDGPSSTVASAFPPFPLGETGVAFGPGYPWAVPAACATLNPEPGFNAATSTLTAFAKSLVLLSPTLGAVSPAWAPYDWKLQEAVDSDGDLIPDQFDADDDNDGILDNGNVGCYAAGLAGPGQNAACCTGLHTGTCAAADNCRIVANPTQCNATQVPADSFGNQCDPDINQSGTFTAADINQFKTNYNAVPFVAQGLGDTNCSGTKSAADINTFKNLYNNVTKGRLDNCIATPASVNCPQP